MSDQLELVPGRFRTVLADPPWHEKGGGKIKRGADRHYSVLKTPDIIDLLLRDCPPLAQVERNAHLYLWVTNTYLFEAKSVVDALGFTYKTNFVWTKDRFGLGQYARGQHELLLFCTRGRGYDVRRAHGARRRSTWIGKEAIAKAAHSEKPDEAHAMIERGSKGPYLELFARQRREGWTVWGNEV